jgi:hypothetical protein
MSNNPETYLDKFLLKEVTDENDDPFPNRPTLRFLGATVTDNPDNNSTDVEGGGAGILFSPVSLMEAVVANSGVEANFATSSAGGGLTYGSTFYISDTVKAHTCTGIRFVWAGHATNIKATLYKWHGSTKTVAGQITIAVAESTSPLPYVEYTASFASPVTLLPGAFYAAALFDTGGSPQYISLGVVGGSGTPSMLGAILGTGNYDSIIASSFHAYAVVYSNGAGASYSPFSLYSNGDQAPVDLSTAFFPVEPVLT